MRNILLWLLILVAGSWSFQKFREYSKALKEEDCFATRISSKIFDFNTFTVVLEEGIDKKDIRIIHLNSGNIIFNNGQSEKGIKNEYGHCLFELYYKNEKAYEFGHFKTNNWYTQDYQLWIGVESDSLSIKFEIFGKKTSFDGYIMKK
ncbi:MAG: hypothetical protein AAF587_23045 [Bacteroidota bacterium]